MALCSRRCAPDFGGCSLLWHLACLCGGDCIALLGMWDGAGEGGVVVSSMVSTQVVCPSFDAIWSFLGGLLQASP